MTDGLRLVAMTVGQVLGSTGMAGGRASEFAPFHDCSSLALRRKSRPTTSMTAALRCLRAFRGPAAPCALTDAGNPTGSRGRPRAARPARTPKVRPSLGAPSDQTPGVRWLDSSARASQGGRQRVALVALMVEQADHDLLERSLTVGEAHIAGRGHRGEPLVG
jgi:hypothetical protein